MALTACNDDDSIIDRTGGNNLQVEVSANFHSRAPILGSTLPDNNPIGVNLTAKDGSSYDNQNYNNIPYSATTADGKQTWMPQDKPVTLSVTEGVAMAYWPYNADAADMTAVPVETDTQTDYMYSGNVTGLTNATPKAAFQMKHAMTLIRVNVVRGTYTAEGAVTAVTAASEAFCTSGTMNVSTGALAGLAGAGTPFLEEPADAAITTAGRVTEFLVLPDVTVDAASVTLGVTVDGRKYNTAVEVSEAFKQGYIYTYNLTLDNTALNVSAVAVTPWDLQSSVDTELNAQDDQYIVQVTIDSDNYTYTHNAYNLTGTIDWGDGTTEDVNSVQWPSHIYEKAGNYIVVATGNMNSIRIKGGPKEDGYFEDDYVEDDNTSNITRIIKIGEKMGITNMTSAFHGTRITEIPEGIFDGLTEVTCFKLAFCDCDGVISIPAGLFDKCTKVTDFSDMFHGSNNINKIPAGLFDNCPEVTNFNDIFHNCSGITEIPEGLFRNNIKAKSFKKIFSDTSIEKIPSDIFQYNTEAEDFEGAFKGTHITEIPMELFKYNTKTKNMMDLFQDCGNITTIPEGLFDYCLEVTNFYGTFSDTGIKNIPANLFKNNTKVTDFGRCFWDTALTNIPAGLFDNCPEVTSFEETFIGGTYTTIPKGLFDKCTKVTTFSGCFIWSQVTAIPEGLFDNCPDVTTFDNCFRNSDINSIPTGLFDKNIKVTTFKRTFKGCTNLTGIPEGLFDKCTKVTDFSYTFEGCSGLTGESPYTTINVDGNEVKVHLYERASYPEHFTTPTDYVKCFRNATGLADYVEITAAGWN